MSEGVISAFKEAGWRVLCGPKFKETSVTLKPFIGPLPGPRVIIHDRPDKTDPLNQFTAVGLKWYEAKHAGFVFKSDKELSEADAERVRIQWLAKLPDYVSREQRRRKWRFIPLAAWIVRKLGQRDLEETFRPDLP